MQTFFLQKSLEIRAWAPRQRLRGEGLARGRGGVSKTTRRPRRGGLRGDPARQMMLPGKKKKKKGRRDEAAAAEAPLLLRRIDHHLIGAGAGRGGSSMVVLAALPAGGCGCQRSTYHTLLREECYQGAPRVPGQRTSTTVGRRRRHT